MPSISVLRQSAAELLASVVIDLFPGALLVRAVATEQGFYCDIVASQTIDDYALPLLEEKMRGEAKKGLTVRSLDMMREVAVNYLSHKGQPIRGQEVGMAKENIVSLIQIGDFCDWCSLPYVHNTQELEFFKIVKIAPATSYVADEGSIEVKRIHGIVAPDKYHLKKAVKGWLTGQKGSHTKWTQERKFFFPEPRISETAWVWEQQGLEIKRNLISWWENTHQVELFQLVATPALIKKTLAEKAGVYEEGDPHATPITEINGVSYVLAPTVAPAHMTLFSQTARSEKELPIRYAEYAPLIFREPAGQLGGILDASTVSADFAHIFCAPSHLEKELISSLQFIDKSIKMFGFEYHWHFVGRGEKFAGTVRRWETALASMKAAFQQCGFTYGSDPQEDSFAGPIAEARLIDRFGREWKGPHVRVDIEAPERFGLKYQGGDHKLYKPWIIARSLFGSLERFVALLLEHTR